MQLLNQQKYLSLDMMEAQNCDSFHAAAAAAAAAVKAAAAVDSAAAAIDSAAADSAAATADAASAGADVSEDMSSSASAVWTAP